MKIFKLLLLLLLATGVGLSVVIFYPESYCCKHELIINNNKVYFCGADRIPSKTSVAAVLNQTQSLIEKSELYEAKQVFKIYIQGKVNICRSLPLQFRSDVAAQTIAWVNNIFVTSANFENNQSTSSHYARKLSTLLAHEKTHVMFENKFGWFKTRPQAWLDDNSKTKLGMFWKEEGYADYVAGDISAKAQINLLERKLFDEYGSEYAKSWLAVKYLIEKEKMTIAEILEADLHLEEVVLKAKKSY